MNFKTICPQDIFIFDKLYLHVLLHKQLSYNYYPHPSVKRLNSACAAFFSKQQSRTCKLKIICFLSITTLQWKCFEDNHGFLCRFYSFFPMWLLCFKGIKRKSSRNRRPFSTKIYQYNAKGRLCKLNLIRGKTIQSKKPFISASF